MSSTQTDASSTSLGETPFVASPGSASAPTDVDANLVLQTKHQIRTLVHEITQLAQSDCSVDEFYEGFLTRVVSALASEGGAVWTFDDSQLRLHYQINLQKMRLAESEDRQARHHLLLRKVAASGEASLVPPQSGPADDEDAGNPTDFLVILGTVRVETDTQAIIEIFQRPGGGPTTQRGYLRFLAQMCDIASDFLKNRRLRSFSDHQSLWQQLEQFIRATHRSLDPKQTAYTIANEGRRVIGADRVSVALLSGKKCTVEAVSGLDSIDRRAEEVKRLGELATAVVAAEDPLWYGGDADDLPPQIENVLHEYIDKSHAKTVAVVPLTTAADESQPQESAKPIGALIVEQLADGNATSAAQSKIEAVAEHGASALANALQHHGVFLMPLWQTLGKAKNAVARNLSKSLLFVLTLVSIVIAFVVTPADFELSSDGTLLPATRQEIYAPVDGVLVKVLAPEDPTAIVDQGAPLAVLENSKLKTDIAALEGRQKETLEQINAVNQMLLSDELRMTPVEEYRLDGQLKQLAAAMKSIEEQLALYREKQSQLKVTSPKRGQVVTWQVRENLLHRPVNRGQRLMTVVDSEGEWELELHVPERRMGHILKAARESSEDLKVTFILATHPGKEFVGRVTEIDRTAEVRGEDGNTVLLRVAIDKNELPDLRAGSKVTAKIDCGRRSLGYVIFQDLIETVQTKVLFWF